MTHVNKRPNAALFPLMAITTLVGVLFTAGCKTVHCWDLNNDGHATMPSEDTNGDGVISVLDCKGSQGPPGSPGGLRCWDLNGNGTAEPSEDLNGDGIHDARDCQGARGAQGPQGVPGPPGANTSAVITNSTTAQCSSICGGSTRVVVSATAPCTVTSQTGTLSHAGPYGRCCVCQP